MRPASNAVAIAVMALSVVAPHATAETVVVAAGRDNMILSNDERSSNGSGSALCVGRTGQPATRRALIRFDLSVAGIPPGSTVNAVTLDLYLGQAAGPAGTLEIHRVLADWGEGGSVSEGCQGSPSQLGDASWLYRTYNPADEAGSPAWRTLGADFEPVASASEIVDPVAGHKTWTSAALAGDVQAWLSDPPANFGWLVMRNPETGASNALRFSSREAQDAGIRPRLIVEYTPPCSADPGIDLVVAGAAETLLDWSSIPGAVSYDVIRGHLEDLAPHARGVDLGTVECLEDDSLDTTTGSGTEPENPDDEIAPPGGGFFYLVRHRDSAGDGPYGPPGECAAERVPGAGDCRGQAPDVPVPVMLESERSRASRRCP